ncbi:SAM-dependent methyltransferase [Dictyobacter alpinus]|uniref:SAM-dependent methyltransferase n=1 Tax=Dictyobacter alpinus TaxID=2014873 RepID=A0A402B3B4_9CHLR|nr:SAM-dependent methyltransferase [Dictyobacter alpinus]GCE25836.1 SAM-dependent methyltransferase [Dictyobacter alpinus]
MQVSSSLQQRILGRIQDEGPISFATYMRMALYEPDYGYYVTGAAKMGWEGDYYTSTDVASFFAHSMGRQLQQMWKQLGEPARFGVLEQGAGRGDLGRQIQQWASQDAPEFADALLYQTADINTGNDALASLAGDFEPAVILSNELVDAFPVHVVEKQGEHLYEIYVTSHNGRLQEILGEFENAALIDYLDSFKVPWRSFADGWRAEINLDALTWMERTSQLLLGTNPKRKRRGFILAIDYGDTARQLYTDDRHYGTLTCYYNHQMSDRPLARPGEQDITAHVNFTALIRVAREQGLRLHALTTQRKWLMDNGIYEELEHIHQQQFSKIDTDRASDQGQIALLQWYNLRQRVSTLTSPMGMGNFKVLIMKR